MFYKKICTDPTHCSNCGEGENYKKQEILDTVIQIIHCYSCDNRAELVEKGEVNGVWKKDRTVR